ncbi:MAG: tetratricopeptide repeat protein, partial [bacterium]|nr:tetratricopeptide repeat protein [bacterium]
KEGLKLINDGEIAKGIKALEEAAVSDNADAQKALVNIYSKGIGVQANHDKASLYAKELVKNNVDGAIDLVKEILASLKDNKPIYLKYLQALCEINDFDALLEASDILINDAKDVNRGIDYLVRGTNAGSRFCAEKLAKIYKEGLYNTGINQKGYVELITKLSNDYPEVVEYTDELVALYEFGNFGVTKDNDIAVNIYREKASHKYNECIYEFRLAELQEFGRLGVKKDIKEALKTYQALLDSFPNNPTYQMKMAEIFEEGKYGVNKDIKKATQIYRSLIAKNPDDLDCIIHMANCYSRSVDSMEQKEAFDLYTKAFEMGSREAGFKVVKLNYQGGSKFPKNYKKAVEAAEKLSNSIATAVLDEKEAEEFRTIKSLEVQMYESGGPMLPKNPRRAKEILNEYNNTHKDKKIKIEKVMWGK